MEKTKIKINRSDIFNYVVGNSNYDAIERCIDPNRYEVFDVCIYDNERGQSIPQSEDYIVYCKQVSQLRNNTANMSRDEIERICEELEEIAPTELNL